MILKPLQMKFKNLDELPCHWGYSKVSYGIFLLYFGDDMNYPSRSILMKHDMGIEVRTFIICKVEISLEFSRNKLKNVISYIIFLLISKL